MAVDPRDLVTKSAVETWLNSNNPSFNTGADGTNIPLAITDCSVDWLSYTGRRSLNRFVPCNDRFDGAGFDRQFLRDFPAALVSAVFCNGIAVPPGNVGQNGTITAGWLLDQKRESISIVGVLGSRQVGLGTGPGGAYAATGGPLMRQRGGYGFGQPDDSGRQNVQIQYFAGGAIMFDEVVTVPSTGPVTVQVSQGSKFYSDLQQVYYATPQNGQLVQLAQVASAPTQGQYSVDATGTYTFNTADATQSIAITYAYNDAMPDVKMACIMQVCETLYTRKSIGLRSQGSPESGTTSYMKVARPDRVRMVMEKYKRALVGV
jgi:hypothetical protein